MNRLLILEDRNTLGEPDGPNRFRLHYEFGWQVAIMVTETLGWSLTPPNVSAEQARAVAHMIERYSHERSWGLHMFQWGDPEQVILRQFLQFLRGGAFQIIRQGSRS